MAMNITSTERSRPMQRLTYSVEEVAEVLGIGMTTAKELIRVGDLPSIKIGRRRLIAHVDLEVFVNELREAA